MTKYFLSILLLIGSLPGSFAQLVPSVVGTSDEDSAVVDTAVVEPSPDFQPSFNGGTSRLYSFINSKIRYPDEAVRDEISGKVVVRFAVCADGQLCDYEIMESPHESLSAESIRIIKSMPRWEPATKNGQPVKVMYSLPIVYQLQ